MKLSTLQAKQAELIQRIETISTAEPAPIEHAFVEVVTVSGCEYYRIRSHYPQFNGKRGNLVKTLHIGPTDAMLSAARTYRMRCEAGGKLTKLKKKLAQLEAQIKKKLDAAKPPAPKVTTTRKRALPKAA